MGTCGAAAFLKARIPIDSAIALVASPPPISLAAEDTDSGEFTACTPCAVGCLVSHFPRACVEPSAFPFPFLPGFPSAAPTFLRTEQIRRTALRASEQL
jgi:hypothetical protein